MGEISINDALIEIGSQVVKERTNGIADLKHILSQNRRSPKIEILGDKAYHQILETLFRVIQIEKSTYTKSFKQNAKSLLGASARLSSCAGALRLAVETGVKKLRSKTVLALIEHITQTLPTPDEGYCEPLVADYFKILRSVLVYQPHPEHFSQDEWQDLVDFCNKVLKDMNSLSFHNPEWLPLANSRADSGRSNHSRSAALRPIVDHTRGTGNRASQLANKVFSRSSEEDLLLCLRYLTCVTNAPILCKAQAMLTNLLRLLESTSSGGHLQQTAFESINSILCRIMTDDVALTLQTLKSLLPLIRRLWEGKSTSLKDCMLVSLLYGDLYFRRLILSTEMDDCTSDLEGLLGVFQQDYCKRPEREQLQLEDLNLLEDGPPNKRPTSTKVFELRSALFKAEKPWTLLYIYASIVVALDAGTAIDENKVQRDDPHNPSKRPRLSKPLDDIFQLTKSLQISEKLFALQVLTFVFDVLLGDDEILLGYLESVSPCLSEDNGTIASWAMLVLTSAAYQCNPNSSCFQSFWLQTWRLSGRYITSSTTCRAACQLMSVLLNRGLVKYSDVIDLINSMINSIDLNGPIDCVDSSCTLWSIILLLRGKENVGLVSEASEHVLRWLCARWRPTKVFNLKYSAHDAEHYSTPNIIVLICICLGLKTQAIGFRPFLRFGSLCQTRLECLNHAKLINYLLLYQDDSKITVVSKFMPILRSSFISLSKSRVQVLSNVIIEHLLAESAVLLRCFSMNNLESASNNNLDVIFVASSLSIIAHTILSSDRNQDTLKERDLRGAIDELETQIILLLSQEKNQKLIDGVYEAFEPFVASLKDANLSGTAIYNGVTGFARIFGPSFWTNFRALGTHTCAGEDELEVNDEFESQESRSRTETTFAEISHNEIQASTDTLAFRNNLAAKVFFFAAKGQSVAGTLDKSSSTKSCIQYMTSLRPHEFLACRSFICELFESQATVDNEDAISLLRYLGEKVVKPYEFERCEVSMETALDIMTGLAEIWINSDGTDVSNLGGMLYVWFVRVVLDRGISSPKVQSSISTMLQRVIKTRPEYAKTRSDSLPSARTSLFKVLQEGNIKVKFNVGQSISDIFGLFVLLEHDNILGDVISSLPSVINWQEGIAIRLFVLAHLAASWPTLLRRCVYAIFETPGHAPESAGHARYCLAVVSESLKLENLRSLFKLFVSQIIYTWLETHPIRSIPYSIFGYNSLFDLLEDVQDEVLAQLVMRGKDEEATQLSNELGKSYEQLLEVSFGKAAAYSIARDVTIPLSRHTQAPGAETRLRKSLGKEQFTSLVTEHFPDILAQFYKTLDGVEDIDKSLQKRPAYAKAGNSYKTMLSISVSETVLPVSQQPSFKARYLIDEIEYLCRRTSYDAESIWSPELYVFVFRELLNNIHPALGSLHACSVLRRIRVLICMAGSTALELYPIEMALHSLRPYLTNTHCAEDAIGMSQYLIEHGSSYLREVPSFLAGVAVSTLTSMKAFLGSTQESTTQESQFRATMSKAHSFHRWFANFLDSYTSPYISGESEQSFKVLMRSARNLQGNGNSTKGTYESDLLLEILEDQRTGRCILNQPSRDLILNLLCRMFEMPPNFRDDILGSDERAALYASVVWKTSRRNKYGENYVLWVGRVLGRAYASTGLIDREMTLETQAEFTRKITSGAISEPPQDSRSSLLTLLNDVLLVDNSREVGLAESILRSIVTRAYGTEYSIECEHILPSALIKAMLWTQHRCPCNTSNDLRPASMKEAIGFKRNKLALEWVQESCVALARVAGDDPVLSELLPILAEMKNFAEQSFPYVLHLVLLREIDEYQATKRTVSEACTQWLGSCDRSTIPHVKMLLKAILYLRKQPLPNETTKADRSRWLEIDYKLAAEAAAKCSMFKTALLFLDIGYSEAAKVSRRSSGIKFEEPTNLLLHIFENIDEQDAFYGVQQPSSLTSMMARLEYENAGFKSLSYRGAHYDSNLRLMKGVYPEDEGNMIKILDILDLNGLSQSLLSKMVNTGPHAIDSMLRTARKLEQWDISAPISHVSSTSTVYRAFQSINNSVDPKGLSFALNTGIKESMEALMTGNVASSSLQATLSTLSILTEADETFSSRDTRELEETWSRFASRDHWMGFASFKHISSLISCRETLLSSISKSKNLQSLLNTSQRNARALECHALLASSKMSRHHGALQNALATATYLSRLVEPLQEVGLDIKAAVQFESANVLWDQGEMTASINMLQDLQHNFNAKSQLIHVGMPELLARLGHQISEARLEKPDEIINRYLVPAIKELHGVTQGDEAGRVFHEFASFCDQQLQNADGLEDFNRIKKLRERKEIEVRDLERMINSSRSQAKEKDNLKTYRAKAKQWFDLDDREYQRLLDSRHAFLRQSLENYLLCLKACEKYDNDALRFSALWLENWESEIANAAVSKHVAEVGSRKFAPLMNQWSSRLLDTPDPFQTLLSSLVLRICIDHPYHGMYQIFAGSKSKGSKDETALARHAAANKIVNQLKAQRKSVSIWLAVHNTNVSFVRFAAEKLEDARIKPGAKVALQKSPAGHRLEQDVQSQKIPPPTMKIALRPDCNYNEVPTIAKFQPEFTLASGISMPKIVTAIGTDGLKYKQLFKGGNDDLRQDSIMEQVFEQVSNLLQAQPATRQRNLGIRTYKVLPLTPTSGIIEFVPNTIPLHDYLMPAHQRHFPRDLKPSACRKQIFDAQSKSVDQRIQTFRYVTDHFHPVLRYFFMERFENPEDWFDRRLAYTRSTAAISILGHVLGLGDRHGHNILLDEKTGEVVHIDLGIAFEQGRVLPVPEVVPFRLTRDLVDGMGLTRTEGVFRRCCEFTLEALRTESYSIMTILDVLRYDPLYSWSLSPLRLKKMQEAQNEAAGPAVGGEGESRRDEPGEADRALTVVGKKLSKSLSVTATVNELIQTATDERNLAVLFCGWAAYA